jgi:hydrogenase maturation factor
MRVLEVDGQRGLARCRAGAGETSTVETALIEPVKAGELLLVHAGTAIGRPSAAESAP